MYLIIDTETSGLFRHRDESGRTVRSDEPGQPHLAELAMIRANADLEFEGTFNAYVRPDGWEMEEGATAVNGLTTEFLLDRGLPVDQVLDPYVAAIKEGRIVVAFNAQHDLRTMRGALRRAGREDLFEQTPNICVMRAMAAYNKAQGQKYKWPTLTEACQQIGYDRDGIAHSAYADARAAGAVLRFLLERYALPEAKVHHARQRPEA